MLEFRWANWDVHDILHPVYSGSRFFVRLAMPRQLGFVLDNTMFNFPSSPIA
jgi:hypothetical protein